MQKLLPLTSLRFFAAASIFTFHNLEYVGVGAYPSLANGVSFFFVLSGFILTYAYGDFSKSSIRAFYLSRFARLWPVHLLTLTAAILLFGPSDFVPDLTACLNALLLQSFAPLRGVLGSYNGVSWSISAEVFFYLSFPLLARSKHFGALYLGIAALTLAYLFGVNALHIPFDKTPGSLAPDHLAMQFPVARILEFATGVAAGRLFLSCNEVPIPIRQHPDALVLFCIVSIFVLISSVHYVSFNGFNIMQMWCHQTIGQFAFAGLIFVLAFERGRIAKFLSWRPLVLLGEISFATYMTHALVLRYFRGYTVDPSLGAFGHILLEIAIVYPLSYVVWRFIEVPAKEAITRGGYFATPAAFGRDQNTIGGSIAGGSIHS